MASTPRIRGFASYMQVRPGAASIPLVRATARAWLYILPAAGMEDLLKVGMTHDPLARFRAFHSRWYEAFDLEYCLLVACERRNDAQLLETALHRQLRDHSCPMPLTIRAAAAGATEWYRGAYAHARRFVDGCAARGHSVEYDSRAVLGPALLQEEYLLDELVRQAHADLLAGWLVESRHRGLIDLIQGHLSFNALVEERLPQDAWHALLRAREG